MNRYRIMHITEFRYDAPVSDSYNEVRLRPLHDDRQSCLSFRLATTPTSRVTSYRDAFANWVHQFNVLPEHRQLRIEAESVVLTHEARFLAPPMRLSELDQQQETWREDYYDYLAATAYVPHPRQLMELMAVAELLADGSVEGFARAASDVVHQRFHYVQGATHVHSSILDSLSHGAGVCQDFAHVLLGMVRMRGIPGRYVSGYLIPGATEKGTESSKQQDVIGGQASHAWAEVYSGNNGWLGFDPTLGAAVGLRHVRLGYGRDYGDVAPVRGIYRGHAGQRLSVDVRVRPALDHEGNEQMGEIPAPPPEQPAVSERAQQPRQQQQQQQQ